ncbi:beta-glucosidase BglX [Caldisalinibacter kiritimatiensis]|uniref:beta-glucosidase n=1 Tax=Caldisalinibacter kiritimatiensis TaxID=1304284 RepID=R1CX50_9FIRM|nr:beta-glucosidase BglX [Caldisalinibacter kiritimatiensis]EOD01204.1 Beta-glucosidase [Caldisalinibacter kiritimatiensis]
MKKFVLSQEYEKKIETLLNEMTLEEKIGQMTQFGRCKEKEIQLIREGRIGSLLNVSGAEKINEFQRIAVEESRIGIPLLIGDDVIHGYKTIFPIPLAEACSWDPELVQSTAEVAAKEAITEGIRWIFAPMVDICRDPRWGRIAEGSGEDTYLGSRLAEARIIGFQSLDESKYPRTAACPKHFAAYGWAEGGRDYNTTDLSERVLRETILPPFKSAIEAGASTIMSAFNDLNGIPASGNYYLLTQILKKDWQFNGFVVSDWKSVEELIPHGFANDGKDAAEKGLKAGVDMDMHSGVYIENLKNIINENPELLKLINESVRRILRVKYWLGLFDNPYVDESMSKEVFLSNVHISKAREAARKSIVLLKNKDNILPLDKNIKRVTVIGPLADDKVNPLGCWACKGNPKTVVTVLDAIKSSLSLNTKITFVKGCEINKEIPNGVKEAIKASQNSDIIIAVLGESAAMSGENHNRAYLGLPKPQQDLIHAIKANTTTPIVTILMNGRPLVIPWLAENVEAIVEAWHLGIQSGNAICDVLFGNYNPSGKLPVTFPRAEGQIPIYYNHKNTGRPNFKKYIDIEETPLYPFGYGLSYNIYKYSNLKLSKKIIKPNESLKVWVDVTNTGNMPGEEIVQLYIRDLVSNYTRPIKELKGFTKVSFQPGETKTIQFTLTAKELSILDKNYNLAVEPGEFYVWVGPNSQEGLKQNFFIK